MSLAARTASSSGPGEIYSVEMAEIRVSERLTDSLAAYGLGACVAVCVYDASMKVAGIAHIVAPEQARFAHGETAAIAEASPGKFADSAIPLLVQKMRHAGAQSVGMRAAIVGGARIFGALNTRAGTASGLEIGDRNIEAVCLALQSKGIVVCGSEVGGSFGRTVMFRVCDGAVVVKQIGGEAKVLTILSRAPLEILP